jgi:hypothetical protein
MLKEENNISIFNNTKCYDTLNSVKCYDTLNSVKCYDTLNNSNIEINTFIGIDVGKYFIDIYCSLNNKYYLRISNNKSSIKSLINKDLRKIKGLNPSNTLVVIDLTGNYETLCRDIFYNSGFTNIHLADGKKINYFRKSKKHNLAKTDKMDSYILSLYGKENVNNNSNYNNSNYNHNNNNSNTNIDLKLYNPDINTKDILNLKSIESRL